MSELTSCNFCTLQDIKRRNKGKKVTTQRDEDGWIRVFVDGKPTGTSFMALTDHCVC
jgi:hypothetical protein